MSASPAADHSRSVPRPGRQELARRFYFQPSGDAERSRSTLMCLNKSAGVVAQTGFVETLGRHDPSSFSPRVVSSTSFKLDIYTEHFDTTPRHREVGRRIATWILRFILCGGDVLVDRSTAEGRSRSAVTDRPNHGSGVVSKPGPPTGYRSPGRALTSSSPSRCIMAAVVCLLVMIYSSESTLLVPYLASSQGCGCSPGCGCRQAPTKQCACSKGAVKLGAACNCGATMQTSHATPFAGLVPARPMAMLQVISLPIPPERSETLNPGLDRNPPDPP